MSLLSDNWKPYGFTLIELLVVLSILGVIIALVGPLTFNAVTRAEITQEHLTLKALFRRMSDRAFLTQRDSQVQLDGKLITVTTDGASRQFGFEHVFFQRQSVSVNKNGFYSLDKISYSVNRAEYEIIVNRDNADKEVR